MADHIAWAQHNSMGHCRLVPGEAQHFLPAGDKVKLKFLRDHSGCCQRRTVRSEWKQGDHLNVQRVFNQVALHSIYDREKWTDHTCYCHSWQ